MLLLQLYPSHMRYHFSLSILLLLRMLLSARARVCVGIYKLEPQSLKCFSKTVEIFKNYGSNIYTDDGDNSALKTQQTT
jgi:hypothetical protein